jgi:signal transduction histidine kinase
MHSEDLTLRGSIEPIADDIPALIIPVSRLRMLQSEKGLNVKPPFAYTVIVFDRDYLRRDFIPSLSRRCFASDDGLDYNVTITTRRDPPDLIYQSSEAASFATSGDALVGLLSLRFDDLLSLSGAGGGRLGSLAISLVRPRGTGDGGPTGLTASEDGGKWQLVLTHRAGSLEAAISSLRLRNLIISASILVLLIASIVLTLVSAQRAKRLARRQIEFVLGVSHELRTPLAVLRSAGDNLAEGVVSDRDQIQRYGALVRRESRRLSEMVEQMLEFGALSSNRSLRESQPVDPTNVIERALADYEPLIRDSGFRIEKKIQPGLPVVMGDASMLVRAVQNLLSNAIKYSGEKRWISLRAETGPAETEVRITIEDRGPGIDSSDAPHIFDPFYRGKGSAVNGVHGSGLGLSLVKQIMTAHGGRVTLSSRLGEGSSFTLHLPLSPRPVTSQAAAAEHLTAGSSAKRRGSET